MILVLGATGFLGSAIRDLEPEGFNFAPRRVPDLLGESAPDCSGFDGVLYCADWYPGLMSTAEDPERVRAINVAMFSLAARMAQTTRERRLVSIGTTACYPTVDRPLSEWMFMDEPLNPRMLGYARSRADWIDLARKADLKHSHLILPNLFGPRDRYEADRSHLLSSWIRDLWASSGRMSMRGDGSNRREFMFVRDAAAAVVCIVRELPAEEILNVGSGWAPTYRELAESACGSLGLAPELTWEDAPCGRSLELMDSSACNRYISPPLTLPSAALAETVEWFRASERQPVEGAA